MGRLMNEGALGELQTKLEAAGLTSAIIHKRENIRYLSGFTGEGLLVITPNIKAIVTDFRYVTQARLESPDWRVEPTDPKHSHSAVVANIIFGDIFKIGFEDDYVSVAIWNKMRESMPNTTFVPIRQIPESIREIKTEAEISAIATACAIACEAFEKTLPFIKVGRTEREVALELEQNMLKLGADSTSFDTIAASGPNGSLPHATPTNRKLTAGDFFTLDFGAMYDGYCSDMTRTVAMGEITPDQRKVYETVLTAQLMALDAIKPGKLCRDIDQVARDYIDNAGYSGLFGHGLGHSLGLRIHEDPRFSQTAGDARVKVGQIMTVEPGIYRPGVDGVRIEDTVVITENGARRLTPTSKELIVL